MNRPIFAHIGFTIFLSLLILSACGDADASARQDEIVVRIAEIEVDADQLDKYKAILREEAAASIMIEAGVISILPMYQKESPTRVRILEIYATREAYKAHLTTPHFLKYKTSTLGMVRSLKLVEMEVADIDAMKAVFRKLGR